VGQGAANIASAFFGGLPATGAIARTAANIKAGARTPAAGIFHAGFLLLFMVLAGGLLAYVPMAVLAAVLLVVAWGMSEAERFILLLRMPIGERSVLLLTFLLTILVDLTVAIGVGVTIASLIFMARMSENVAITSPEQADTDVEDASQREHLPTDVEVMRISGPFFFGVAGELLDALKRIGRRPRAMILRLDEVPFLDASGAIALHEFLGQARTGGTSVILCGLRADLLALVERVSHDRGKDAPLIAADYPSALALSRELVSSGLSS
jgi:SulP family sulfate permease